MKRLGIGKRYRIMRKQYVAASASQSARHHLDNVIRLSKTKRRRNVKRSLMLAKAYQGIAADKAKTARQMLGIEP